MVQSSKMLSPSFFIPRFLFILFLLGILRKFWKGQNAMEFVRKCAGDVALGKLIANPHFNLTISHFPDESPILVMFLNGHIVQMTLNWLCNTREMEGVHSRLLLITLDQIAERELARLWPNLRRLNLAIPCLQCPFRYGDGPYQLFFVLRANIARILVEMGKSFWMVQQDTFWRSNLLQIGMEQQVENADVDLLFDRADQNGQSRLIAGGYFYARPTRGARAFFDKLAEDLMEKYIPDNVWMSRMCSLEGEMAKCGFIPFETITNWRWIYGGGMGWGDGRNYSKPALIQFDGETENGGKLAKMQVLGFYFLDENGQKCKTAAIDGANRMVNSIGHPNSSTNSPSVWHRSYSQWQFALYQSLIEQFYKYSASEWLLNHLIFPNAHFLMFTI